ncbi:hypothetical protein [Marinifilum caeruleilacunae]|uniref:Uncharacterized protein n=1 Tax=Marinifilum caeruleilacunae TaxID=2499076 RepID=A0ABX1X0S1_9BACT|nr:hypothetical protein [Marinifilum caeruleilacunae]NOU61992.1 hypothetical protein [Marinifilum caeruleilacunae]
MKGAISLISLIIIILLGIVLKDTLYSINIAATKNEALQRQYLMKVKEIKNVDSLYIEIENQINYRKRERNELSKKAIRKGRLIGISMILVILNTILIFIRTRRKNRT